MFTHHIIKEENNKQELYLYIDCNYEFAIFDKIKKELKNNIYDHVIDYLKTHKINFNGEVIHLVLNGIIIGSILLSYPNMPMKSEEVTDYKYIGQLSSMFKVEDYPSNNNDVIDKVVVKDKVEAEEEVVEKKEVPQESNERVSDNTTKRESTSESADKKSEQSEKKEQAAPVAPKQETSSDSNEKDPIIDKKEEVETTETMVTLYRSSGIVETIPLETYIVGVVGGEMPAAFQTEALKAQSVAARTYALKMIRENKTLTDTVSTQVYKDNNQLKALWGSDFDFYYNKIKNAVTATEGQYVSYNNYYIDAVYHSTNNGKTESSLDVFGNYFPYLISVDSHWDIQASSYLRETTKEINVVDALLGIDLNKESQIQVVSRTDGDKIDVIKIDGKEFAGEVVRETLGLRSTDFDIIVNDNDVTFVTRGFGHGVGMSQYGANGMAKEGYSYQNILMHYYPGTVIQTEP